MHRKSIEAAEQLKSTGHSPCEMNESCSNSNSVDNDSANNSGGEEEDPMTNHQLHNHHHHHQLNPSKMKHPPGPDFSSLHFPNNNSLIRRHSSVASLRAKAQQHMSNLGIPTGDEEHIDIDHVDGDEKT
jgi:hypothetical protein